MIKDHQIGEMNNQLRFIALKFAKAEQLRSRLAGVVAPLIDQANDEILTLRAKCEVLRFERNVAQAELGIANKQNIELERDIEEMDYQPAYITSLQKKLDKAEIESSEARHELRMIKRRPRQNG
jgi:hypothetical protein